VNGHEKAKRDRLVDSGQLKDGILELGDEVVVVGEEGEVGTNAGLDSGVIEELGEAFPASGGGQAPGSWSFSGRSPDSGNCWPSFC